MKKIIFIFLLLISIFFFISCENKIENDNQKIKEIDVNTRIEIFISSVFNDPKIILFDNFDNMDEELQQYVFFMALYKGTVFKRPLKIGEGLTKEMIEANIQALFGDDIISKLDYKYILADYDEQNEIYVPFIYGAPSPVAYAFHKIENVRDNIYRTLVSSINVNADFFSYNAAGGEQIRPPDYIREMEKELDLLEEGFAVKRTEILEEFKQEILRNPEKYEIMELYLEVGDGYIHLLSAKKFER